MGKGKVRPSIAGRLRWIVRRLLSVTEDPEGAAAIVEAASSVALSDNYGAAGRRLGTHPAGHHQDADQDRNGKAAATLTSPQPTHPDSVSAHPPLPHPHPTSGKRGGHD